MKYDIDAVFNSYSKTIFWSLVAVLILSVLILLNRHYLLNPWQIQEINLVQPDLGLAYTAQSKQLESLFPW